MCVVKRKNDLDERIEIDGLWHVAIEPRIQCERAVARACIRGNGNGRRASTLALTQGTNAPYKGIAVLVGHGDIRNDDMRLPGFE